MQSLSLHKSFPFKTFSRQPFLHYKNQTNSVLNKTTKHKQTFDHRRIIQTQAKSGLGDEDVDVAVFRFTLGIPGFEDRFIPRVIGTIILTLMLINHFFSGDYVDGAQIRTEVIVSVLAVMCIIAPSLEERLQEVLPGRGRKAATEEIVGAINAFVISDQLEKKLQQELAWISFALLKNTNSCSVFVVDADRKVIMARGAVNEKLKGLKDQDLLNKLFLKQLDISEIKQAILQDKGAVQSSWVGKTDLTAKGIQSAICEPLQTGGCLVVFSENPRAYQERDRKWVNSLAQKLSLFF
eukprot:TRINITY_DN7565_c0_g1_i7.p1 TRINITY_DN7565_c0_g1~~TRINITY_DN7565_c0_g1_i7.p1  ORF type:complete len:295 (-),score=38.42 TRINITY_DN7565_c0_g1_i7:125-1009(-)